MARGRLVAGRQDLASLAASPKSFWTDTAHIDTEKQWITHYDEWPVMRLEADLIYGATLRGIPWESAQELELWQLASAFGLHRVETRAEHDEREIVEAKREEWESTEALRMDKLGDYSARKKQRELERRQKRRREAESDAG